MDNHKIASQEDPITVYIIVRESLNMSIGKTSAQCAHASQMLTLKYFEMKDESRGLQRSLSNDPNQLSLKEAYRSLAPFISIFGEWISSGIRKVVLKADEKEWFRLIEEIKVSPHVIVCDAGLTELEPGTNTVVGLWPIRKSQVNKVVKRLQVLK